MGSVAAILAPVVAILVMSITRGDHVAGTAQHRCCQGPPCHGRECPGQAWVHSAHVSCLQSWGSPRCEAARHCAVVQAQACPTKRPDRLWQHASKAKLIPRRKRTACSCPSNEWLAGRQSSAKASPYSALRKLPQHTREKTKMPHASEVMKDHNE